MKINYDELMNFNNIQISGDTTKVDEIIEYEEILFEISNSLKKYRKENNLTQAQLAKLLETEQVMISKLESGTYNPTFKQLHKISRRLTNSADLFLNTLENIITTINQMYKTTYSMTLEKETYKNKNKKMDIVYINDYAYNNLQGGIYGTEKCTSAISIAG